ncbi:hypothetical protein ACWD5F_40780 [Streptomyces sp. NPDC002499]
MTGALRGEADGRAADLDGEAFGVDAPAEGDVETADGDGVEDFFFGDADVWVSSEAAALAAAGCGPDRSFVTRQTTRLTAISAAALPIISSRLRLRCRAA